MFKECVMSCVTSTQGNLVKSFHTSAIEPQNPILRSDRGERSWSDVTGDLPVKP